MQISYIHGNNLSAASEPLNISVVQEGPTSLRVYWVLPEKSGHTIGYRIYYTGGSNGSVDVEDEFVDNYLLTGLVNAASYTVSIAAKSLHLPSERVQSRPIQLGVCHIHAKLLDYVAITPNMCNRHYRCNFNLLQS